MSADSAKPPQEESGELGQALLYARDLARVRGSQLSLRRRLDAAGRPQSGKILVADDESSLRLLLSLTLALEHYEILEASTGTDALALVQRHHPDLVLLDIRMPGLSGLDVCREIKADPALKDIPVIIVSALAMPADLEAGREAGASHYISKPFSPLHLVEVIGGLLEGRVAS